jgi:hypothetical protein
MAQVLGLVASFYEPLRPKNSFTTSEGEFESIFDVLLRRSLTWSKNIQVDFWY